VSQLQSDVEMPGRLARKASAHSRSLRVTAATRGSKSRQSVRRPSLRVGLSIAGGATKGCQQQFNSRDENDQSTAYQSRPALGACGLFSHQLQIAHPANALHVAQDRRRSPLARTEARGGFVTGCRGSCAGLSGLLGFPCRAGVVLGLRADPGSRPTIGRGLYESRLSISGDIWPRGIRKSQGHRTTRGRITVPDLKDGESVEVQGFAVVAKRYRSPRPQWDQRPGRHEAK
jgi:hypothetical protein